MLEILTDSLMLPPLKSLPAFIAVAETLNFTKAATRLNVTHSAISQSIRALENYLGHTLFDRTSRTVTLNANGIKYYTTVKSALEMISESTKQQRITLNSNIINLKVMTTLSLMWLIPRIPLLNAKYPDIDLRVSSNPYHPMDVETNNIQAAIAYGNKGDWGVLKTDKLFDDSLVLIGNQNHIKQAAALDKLLAKNKAIFVDVDLRKDDWGIWCDAANCKVPNKKNRIIFQNTSQAIQATLSGVGVMVTHMPFVTDLLASNDLSLLSNNIARLDKSYFLVYAGEAIKNQHIKSLIRWIKKEAVIDTAKNIS
jgi:DNA-binding transcriptional LysR family regulator